MSNLSMWQCPHCGEQHEAEFRQCWKCGSNSAGDLDPNFEVSEPASQQDQGPEEPAVEVQLPPLQLPTVTYFSIPPYICLSLWFMLKHHPRNRTLDFTPSTAEIIAIILSALMVGIPIFVTAAKAFWLTLGRRSTLSNTLAELLWMLSMFRLPKSFRQVHGYGWFTPIYYGSLAALLLAPLGMAAWMVIESF